MRGVLSRREVERVYDRVGQMQDAQAFYEAPALAALVRHGDFGAAQRVVEVGCGTGRFAARLLRDALPPDARYRGVDLSRTMTRLARRALRPFSDRATVTCTDGRLRFDLPDASQDRVVATYVLDLLSDADVRTFLDEAHRLLAPGGRLCVAGLTWGVGPVSTLVAHLWDLVHAARPTWVGGCRPMNVRARLSPRRWHVAHREVVTPWGVPSEVLVAEKYEV